MVSKVTVVCQEQKPLCVIIETADRIKPGVQLLFDNIHDRRPVELAFTALMYPYGLFSIM